MNQKNVFIFCVSKEILEGIVVDRNAAFMAARVSDLGYRVRNIQVLDRVESELVGAFKWALEHEPSYVFATGGMGPGFDDITRACVAKAAGVPLIEDQRALEMIGKSYRRLMAKGIVEDADINQDRIQMARVPEGSVCYENPIGTAPAIQLKVGPTTVFMLPGVPAEMQRMFTLYVIPALSSESPGIVKKAVHVDYHGRDESAISRLLHDLSRRHKGILTRARVQGTEEDITIRITLFGEHTDEKALDSIIEQAESDLRARLGLEMESRPTDASREGD